LGIKYYLFVFLFKKMFKKNNKKKKKKKRKKAKNLQIWKSLLCFIFRWRSVLISQLSGFRLFMTVYMNPCLIFSGKCAYLWKLSNFPIFPPLLMSQIALIGAFSA